MPKPISAMSEKEKRRLLGQEPEQSDHGDELGDDLFEDQEQDEPGGQEHPEDIMSLMRSPLMEKVRQDRMDEVNQERQAIANSIAGHGMSDLPHNLQIIPEGTRIVDDSGFTRVWKRGYNNALGWQIISPDVIEREVIAKREKEILNQRVAPEVVPATPKNEKKAAKENLYNIYRVDPDGTEVLMDCRRYNGLALKFGTALLRKFSKRRCIIRIRNLNANNVTDLYYDNRNEPQPEANNETIAASKT